MATNGRGRSGSLTGWSIDTTPGTTGRVNSLTRTQEQLAELRRALSVDGAEAAEAALLAHLADTNNPHHISLRDVDLDVSTELLPRLTPGTLPDHAPVFAYAAEFPDPHGWSVTRATPMTLLNAAGYTITHPTNTVAIDHRYGLPLVALHPACTNQLVSTDVTAGVGSAVGGSLVDGGSRRTPARDTQHRLVREDTSTGAHGYSVALTADNGVEHTTSLFVYPLIAGGVLRLSLPGVHGAVGWVDLSTGATSASSTGLIVHAVRLANGWWQIGVQYLASGTSGAWVVAWCPDSATSSHTGTERDLFLVWLPQHVTGAPGLGPLLATSGGPASCDASVLTLALDADRLNPEAGCLLLEHVLMPSLTGLPSRPLANLDDALVVALNGSLLTVTDNRSDPPVVHSVSTPRHTLARTAVSYAGDAVCSMTSGAPKLSTPGSYAALGSQATLTLGPVPGYLSLLALYPEADTNRLVQFLIGEDTAL